MLMARRRYMIFRHGGAAKKSPRSGLITIKHSKGTEDTGMKQVASFSLLIIFYKKGMLSLKFGFELLSVSQMSKV